MKPVDRPALEKASVKPSPSEDISYGSMRDDPHRYHKEGWNQGTLSRRNRYLVVTGYDRPLGLFHTMISVNRDGLYLESPW